MADDASIFEDPRWSPDSDLLTLPKERTPSSTPSPSPTPTPDFDKPLTPEQRRAGAIPFKPPGSDKEGTAALDRGEKFLAEHPLPETDQGDDEPTKLPEPAPTPKPEEKEAVPTYREPEFKDIWYATEGSTFGTGLDGPDPDDNGVGHWGADTTDPYRRGIALPADAISTFYNVDPDDRDFAEAVRAGKVLVQVYNPATKKYAIGPLVDEGPASRTGRGIDLLQQTALDLGIDNPRTWTGPLQINPWYNPEAKAEAPVQKQVPQENPLAARSPELPVSPAEKWRKAHPEDAKLSDSDLAAKVQGYLKLDTPASEGMGWVKELGDSDFLKAFTAKDNGESLNQIWKSKTNALTQFRAKYPGKYDDVSDSDLMGALYEKNHEKGESYKDFALRWKPTSDGNALALINASQGWWDNLQLLGQGTVQGLEQLNQLAGKGMEIEKQLPVIGPIISLFSDYSTWGFDKGVSVLARGGGGSEKLMLDWLRGDQAASEQFHASVVKPLTEKIFGHDILGDAAKPINDAARSMTRNGVQPLVKMTLDQVDAWDQRAAKDQELRLKDPVWRQFAGNIIAGFADPSNLAVFSPWFNGVRGVEALSFAMGMQGIISTGRGYVDKDPDILKHTVEDMGFTGLNAMTMNSPLGRIPAILTGAALGGSERTIRDIADGKNTTWQDLLSSIGTSAFIYGLGAHRDVKPQVPPGRAGFERPAVRAQLPGVEPEQGPVQEGKPPLAGGKPAVIVAKGPGNVGNMQIIAPVKNRQIVWMDVDALADVPDKGEANKAARDKVKEALALGNPIKAPEVALNSKGNLIFADENAIDAIKNLRSRLGEYVPVDVDAKDADALDKRGVILPWESGGDPNNAVSQRVFGEHVVNLTPAQQQMLDEAKDAFEKGDRPKAQQLLGTIFADLPQHDQERILRTAQAIWDEHNNIKPDSKGARDAVAGSENKRADDPEKDKSNPNGSLPTSPNLDQEAYRLGAFRLADFQAHWDQIGTKLRDRLLQRFNIDPADPMAKFQLWGGLAKFYHYLRDNGNVPLGLTRREWDALGQTTKHAIALEASRQRPIVWYDFGGGNIAGYQQELDVNGNPTGLYNRFDSRGVRGNWLIGPEVLPELVKNFFLGEPSERPHGPPTPGDQTRIQAYALEEFRNRGILDQIINYFRHGLTDFDISTRMPNVPEHDARIVRRALGIPDPNHPDFQAWANKPENQPDRSLTSLPPSGTVGGGQPRQPGHGPGVAPAQGQRPAGVPPPHGGGPAPGERGGNEAIARDAANVVRRAKGAGPGLPGVRAVKQALLDWARQNGLVYDYNAKAGRLGNGVEHVAYRHPTDPNKIVKFFQIKERGWQGQNFWDTENRLEEINKRFNQEWYGFDKFIGIAQDAAGDLHLVFEQPFVRALKDRHGNNIEPTFDQRKAGLERKGYIVTGQYSAYNPFTKNYLTDLHEQNVILTGIDANGVPHVTIIDAFIKDAPAHLQQQHAGRTPARFPTAGLGPGWREVERTTMLQDPKKELVRIEHDPTGRKAVMIRDKPPPPPKGIEDVVRMEKRWKKDQNGQEIKDANGRRKGYWNLQMTDKFGQHHERNVFGIRKAAENQRKAMFDFYNNQNTGDPRNPKDPNANFYAGIGTIDMWDQFMDNLHNFLVKPLLQAAGVAVKPFAKGARDLLKWTSGLPPIRNFYEHMADVLGLDVEYKDPEGQVHKAGDVARGEMKRARAQMMQVANAFQWRAAQRMGLAEKLMGGFKPAVRAGYWITKNRKYILDAVAGYQRGEHHDDPQTEAILQFYGAVQNAIYETERLFGINYRHVDNYFYGIYKNNPREANAAIARWETHLFRKFGNLPDYVKPKVFHDYLEADLKDYAARFYNPEHIFQARLAGFFHNINKILAFRGLLDAGLAARYDDPIAALWKRENGLTGEEGWWKAHNGEKYMFRPDVYHLVRNAFSPNDTVRLYAGGLINGLRWLKMVTSTLELGLSALHMKHIAGISVADVLATQKNIDKNTFAGRQLYRMMVTANTLRNMVPWDRIKLPDKIDPITRKRTERFINLPLQSWRGQRDVLAYMRGEGPRPLDPQSDHIIRTLVDAGFGVNQLHEGNLGFVDNMAEWMGGRGLRFSQEWLDKLNQVPGLKGKLPTTGPVFLSWHTLGLDKFIHGQMGNLPTLMSIGKFLTGESWFRDQMMHRQIPMAKIQAIMLKANELFIERPDLKDPATPQARAERQAALSKIGHVVETRYGEMQYDNLFAARWLKTVGINSLLSMGWKIGMFRTYGKAVYDLGKNALHLDELIQKKIDQDPTGAMLTGDMKFALYYTAVVGTQNLIISYLTGAMQPDKKKYNIGPFDMVYPRIGTDNKGRPIRMRDPFWLGSYIEMYRHVLNDGAWNGLGTTFGHWSSPPIAMIFDMLQNRDYRGREITDPAKSFIDPQTLWDRLTYIVRHVTPISLQNALYTTRDPRDALWGFFGYSPASSWTMRTSTENRILDFADKHRPGTFNQRREYREKQDAVDQYRYALEVGSPKDIAAAREALKHVHPPLSEKQVHAIIKHAELSPAESVFKSLTKEDKAELLEEIPDKERPYWLHLAGKEGIKAYHDLLRQKGKRVPKTSSIDLDRIINQSRRLAWSDVQIPAEIPRLQEGGIVTQPTTAVIGEAGPEAVIPLNKLTPEGKSIVQQLLSSGSASQGGETGAVAGQIYPSQLLGPMAPPASPLAPTSGHHQVSPLDPESEKNPDLMIPRKFQKGGDILPGQVFPYKDFDALMKGKGSGARPGEDDDESPKEDTVIPTPGQRFTTEEDYHELPYNYGDKLPKNRGIPIPLESPDNPLLQM